MQSAPIKKKSTELKVNADTEEMTAIMIVSSLLAVGEFPVKIYKINASLCFNLASIYTNVH